MAFTVHAVMPGVWHIVDCMGVCMTLLEGENAAMLVDTGYGIEDVADFMLAAKTVFNCKIMNNPQKTALEIGTYTLYTRLLDVFSPACFNFSKNNAMSYQETRALTLMGTNAPSEGECLYTAYLRVLDFVSGMTDDYATFISQQFSGTAAS